jgi:hypothetical protein
MLQSILSKLLDNVMAALHKKLANLDLDKDGTLDLDQLKKLLDRAHVALDNAIKAINEPELSAVADEVVAVVVAVKALLKRLEGAVNMKEVGSSISTLKLVAQDLVAYIKHATSQQKEDK